MRGEIEEITEVVSKSLPAAEASLLRAVGRFADSLVQHEKKQNEEIERIRGEMKRGSRQGTGRFHL